MCTVAVQPLGDGGYLLGHNRDESRLRSRADPPRLHRRRDRTFLAPVDPDAGGTWITVNDAGLTVCMLNAADAAPERLPRTPISRGLVALDMGDCLDLSDLRTRLDTWGPRLSRVRAFHLVAVAPGDADRPVSASWHRWSGVTLDLDDVAAPGLFVSALLDQSGAERVRGASWRRFLEHRHSASPVDLADWLAGHDPQPGMLSTCVHRDDACTVSRTVVTVDRQTATVDYHDGSPCDPGAPETRLTLAIRVDAGE